MANELAFPNGMVITPDNRTLVVAESFAARLTAFDIADDGTLSNRRVRTQLGLFLGMFMACRRSNSGLSERRG